MAVLVQELSGAGMVRERIRSGLTAEVFSEIDGLEPVWRALEAEPGTLVTPYQRFDWVRAYLRALPAGADPRFVLLRTASGRPCLLLPLVVTRVRGIAIARVIGDTHANYHLPIVAGREAAAMVPDDLTARLTEAGRAAGIDVYALNHQPSLWGGAANPLAAGGDPAPSNGYGLLLGPDPESTLRRVFSGDARKKMRSKEKRLIEAFGPIAYRRAETAAEVERFLAAFYAQKSRRFAGMGVADPYAADPIRRFLAQAASGKSPAIELHALCLRDDGRVLAVFGGAVDAVRYSGMLTSFDAEPDLARFSPGDLLLHHLLREQTERGRTSFDLGVGEARYKANICDETIELVQRVLPVTLRGRAYGLAATGFNRAKRRIKRSPRLLATIRRLRRLSGD